MKSTLSIDTKAGISGDRFAAALMGLNAPERELIQAGQVTAIHDPTEGDLVGAFWDLAEACVHTLIIDSQAVIMPPISRKICQAFGINPLETIASGALLLTTPPEEASAICHALQEKGGPCVEIGTVEIGSSQVLQSTCKGSMPLPRLARDEIARVFEE